MSQKCETCHGDGFYIAFRSSGDEEVECKKCGGTGVKGGVRANVTGTESRVCADIAARQAKGVAKYGTTVEANPLPLREWLQHAYEETLDKAVYLKRAIEEMGKEPFQRFFDAAEKTDAYKQERQALKDAREFDKEPG